jgi:cell division protein FtsI/penicillin-binding protein 2
MGIILNDGLRLPVISIRKLHFAADTPYETVFERDSVVKERVMHAEVARSLRRVLADVVTGGTAIRLSGSIVTGGGMHVVIGGKTGSGDNRFEVIGRGGNRTSRAVSRTGTFVFYIGDRYFGVMTAYVAGDKTGQYRFTSALPVAALKLLAPDIASLLSNPV